MANVQATQKTAEHDGTPSSRAVDDAIQSQSPSVPTHESSSQPIIRPSVDASRQDSFPFEATPGTVGPAPTTDVLANGHSQAHSSIEIPDALEDKSTIAERKSVAFRGRDGGQGLQRAATWDGEDETNGEPAFPRGASFLGKLRAIAASASPVHARSPSVPALSSTAMSPQIEREEPMYHMETEENEPEADIEDDSDEQTAGTPRTRRRRRMRRPQQSGSTPSTPMASRFASFIREHQPGSRPAGLKRRATMSEVDEDPRGGGVSEDEGRDRLRRALRRGLENARGIGSTTRRQEGDGTAADKRPSNFRRLTAFGNNESGSPFRLRAERASSMSAQRWRQVKAGIKLLGQRKRDERIRVDYQKSAQLMAEIAAGAPAALVLASFFQRDEHGRRRIPALLEQLKIRITKSSEENNKSGDRHLQFKIELEYGSGTARLNWTIVRSLRDFVNLHLKYKVQGQTERLKQFRGEDKSKARIPHFPTSAFPYGRQARGLFEGLDDEGDEEQPSQETTTTERPTHRNRRLSSFHLTRRSSNTANDASNAAQQEQDQKQKSLYNERQRQQLETYLQQMIRWVIFRPDSNRLCKFLELSALSIRLAAENGYQGKQGLLAIASRQNREIRRAAILGPGGFAERHKPRWTLIRHSYIVIVDGPESVTPYDVFLVDPDFSTEKHKKGAKDQSAQDRAMAKTTDTTTYTKHHIIRLYNSERKLKLIARNERQWLQFQESIDHMAKTSIWTKKQRFASYAPVRDNVWCRWLVDGRDHMWQVSRAIDNAKDFIYIHDWWLSPELYMRRPAAISQKWRLDRLLQRKAEEGVKIFVIVYRNIESAIPIDSEYTKWALLDLHENICVQRSPNQFRQNQFFWAHHEKLVVIDNMMAFCGGVDLCFGRWDDSCHSLVDDKLTGFELDHNVPRDSEHCQVWPGKDYSNPRVQDFYALDRPYEEMYDRTKVPRMPWHDISMQIVGQPARDIGRHFVQRWNYILRQRIPSRPTPVLMPPPEYDHQELERLGMTGTCQVQILRSCSPWSIGTPNKVEHSIMNAYCALIEASDHFVYIENQFFISSCVVEGTPIHNKIGDALVERIFRAHDNGEKWQACLVIPLMPGFQNEVDAQDGTSVRLIMQCQFRSICRGESSIFGRLRSRNINPEDYIRFYSLRQWGKIGPRKCLTTEQLYIHAKCMVVDDRHAIIGSANINERSMLGSRDSEVAAIVTDMNMIPSKMAGEPYMVGEFTHTLRMRLMREHIGIDVDALYRQEQMEKERKEQDAEMDYIYRDDAATTPENDQIEPSLASPPALDRHESEMQMEQARVKREEHQRLQDSEPRDVDDGQHGKKHKRHPHELKHDLDVAGFGQDNERQLEAAGELGYRDSYVDAHGHEVLRKDVRAFNRHEELQVQRIKERMERDKKAEKALPPPWPAERLDTVQMGLPIRSQLPELPLLDDTDIGGPPGRSGSKLSSKFATVHGGIRQPTVTENCMQDPLDSDFYDRIWHQVAENNTKLYRQVFRCQPDSEVLDWKMYDKFNDYNERFMQSQGLGRNTQKTPKEAPPSGPPGSAMTASSIAGDAGELEKSKAKGVLGGFMNKIRQSSKVSVDAPETNEKSYLAPGSPGSGASSGPTAVPSPETRPLDEKYDLKRQQQDGTHEDGGEDNHPERRRNVQVVDYANSTANNNSTANLGVQQNNGVKTRKRGNTRSGKTGMDDILSRDDAEDLLKTIQGHLVLWPYDWLEKEERNGNWLYSIDTLAPLEIYD